MQLEVRATEDHQPPSEGKERQTGSLQASAGHGPAATLSV